MWGLSRVIALEHPELQCVRIDLDPEGIAAGQAQALFTELWTPDKEDQVAIRRQTRYVARLMPGPALSQPGFDPIAVGWQHFAVYPEATYLVTGGLSGLGLLVARWLVKQGARHLVLVGRSSPAEAAREEIAALEHLGVQVTTAQVDISHREQVAGILAEIEASMPPLRGIVHSAGVLDDGVLLQQDWSRFARVMAPKVDGAWHLHTLTLNKSLDFFVLFSSVAALLGSSGQGNHAAANAFLDALAHYRRVSGLTGLSINWGAWSEIGAAAAHHVSERLATQGMRPITPQEGLRALEDLLQLAPVQAGVMSIQWPILMQQFLPGQIPPLFTEVVYDRQAEAGVESLSARQPRLLDQLADAPPDERLKLILAHLKRQAAKVLGLKPGQDIDPQQPLQDFGLDSLMAIDLKNRIEVDMGVVIPVVDLLQGHSLNQVAAEAAGQFAAAGALGPAREAGQYPDAENKWEVLTL